MKAPYICRELHAVLHRHRGDQPVQRKSHFCPRDRTPHQGLMGQDVFDKALERAAEYRQICIDSLGGDAVISLCGLGEPLLNRNLAGYVAQVRAAGMEVTVSSNGSLLTEELGREFLDAGLQNIFLNIGEEGDDYEAVYQLPFERTCRTSYASPSWQKGAAR